MGKIEPNTSPERMEIIRQVLPEAARTRSWRSGSFEDRMVYTIGLLVADDDGTADPIILAEACRDETMRSTARGIMAALIG